MTYDLKKNTIQGWMGDGELLWLYNQACLMSSVVEIGSWRGRSTHALLSGCKDGIVYAVDHWLGSPSERATTHNDATKRDIYAEFMQNVGHFQNLKVFRDESLKACAQFEDRSIDMVFIDGDHQYEATKADIRAWIPKCRRLICGHDFSQGDTKRALTDALVGYGYAYENPRDTTIWSIQL